MEKKMNMVLGGIELAVALGVATLVGGALTMVKPSNLGVIKKIAVGIGGLAISAMATDGVVNYVDTQFTEVTKQIKELFTKKNPEKKTDEEEEAE